MDQLKNFTGWGKGRFIAYLLVLFAGLGLAALSRMGFGTYTELPDGAWKWGVEVTSVQLDIFIGVLLAGGGSGVFAMIKGLRTRVGDIPAAARLGEKDIPIKIDTAAVKVAG